MVEEQYEESCISSRCNLFSEQVFRGFSDQRMDRNETDLERRAGSQIGRRHVLEDEVRRLLTLIRGEEDMASRMEGRGCNNDLTRFQEELGMRSGGCRGMTLAQVQSLEDRIASRVEMRVATMFDCFAASFEIKMAMAFERLRMLGVSSHIEGYALVPSVQVSGNIMLAKPDEGRRGWLRSTEVANKKKPDEDWVCVFCELAFTSKASLEEHFLKVGHYPPKRASCSPDKRKILDDDEAMEKKSKSAKLCDFVGGSKSGQATPTLEEGVEQNDSQRNKNVNFWCETCHLQLNSMSVMESHIKGKKHLKLSAKNCYSSNQGR